MVKFDHLPPPLLVHSHLLSGQEAASTRAGESEVGPEEFLPVLPVETVLEVTVVGCYLFSFVIKLLGDSFKLRKIKKC